MGRVGRRQLREFDTNKNHSYEWFLFATIHRMDTVRPWAIWRRIIYGSGFFASWAVVVGLVYFVNYYEPANCFDGELNGDEVEVDAGGSCIRIPVAQVTQPRVAWKESFEIAPGQYNAVAYVENRNLEAGTPEFAYTFTFYNENEVVATRSGTTELPPNSTYPVFEGRVFTNNQPITATEFTYENPSLWLPATNMNTQFRTVDLDLQDPDGRPKLAVRLENTALTGGRDVEVVATIFNDLGAPVTASETRINEFPAQSIQNIEFTWPQSIAKTVRSCSIPTDVVLAIDVSGSMNNDNDIPPQPLTDAVAAASSFADRVGEEDQVGIVRFATEASVVQPLTLQHSSAAAAIRSLEISEADETGFTNTAAAIEQAAMTLSSSRPDARRALVLLTDGLPTAEGDADAEELAISAAESLSNSGADVYAIGLGNGVNQLFIEQLASQPAFAYQAPQRSDLQEIYNQITEALCEVGPTKFEVIAKTATNFAPLE